MRDRLIKSAQNYLGKPYVWGGESDAEGGYDCSGYIYRVLNDSGIKVGRTTAQGYYNKYCKKEKHKKIAKKGDLLFFGANENKITHIAIAKDCNYMYESIGSSKNTKNNKGKGITLSPIDRRKDLVWCIDITDGKEIYYPKYTGKSSKIDTVFCEIGAPYGNVSKRTIVAIHNGIQNYKGTLSQNLVLIKLAKNGTLLI